MSSAHDLLAIAGPSALKDAFLDGADARFCRLTNTANQAFKSRDGEAASRFYDEALAEAERLFQVAQLGGTPLLAPMAYTIACHNAAEARKKAGDRIAAHGLKRLAVEKLVETAQSPTDPLALRVNCVRHLRHALAFLAEDLADGEAENRAEFERLIARCRAVEKELARVVAHVMSERECARADDTRSSKQGRLN